MLYLLNFAKKGGYDSESSLHVIRLSLVATFPDLTKDDGRMETIEYGKWHADVHNDYPWPQTVKL